METLRWALGRAETNRSRRERRAQTVATERNGGAPGAPGAPKPARLGRGRLPGPTGDASQNPWGSTKAGLGPVPRPLGHACNILQCRGGQDDGDLAVDLFDRPHQGLGQPALQGVLRWRGLEVNAGVRRWRLRARITVREQRAQREASSATKQQPQPTDACLMSRKRHRPLAKCWGWRCACRWPPLLAGLPSLGSTEVCTAVKALAKGRAARNLWAEPASRDFQDAQRLYAAPTSSPCFGLPVPHGRLAVTCRRAVLQRWCRLPRSWREALAGGAIMRQATQTRRGTRLPSIWTAGAHQGRREQAWAAG